jgi:hypothetical protein
MMKDTIQNFDTPTTMLQDYTSPIPQKKLHEIPCEIFKINLKNHFFISF